MELLNLPVAEIHEYENNPRINDHAVQGMADLIEAHGFRVPILVREGEDGDWDLVDGHLRIKAARLLELEEVPALDVSDMDEDQVVSFRISVNRAAELADWDVAKLVEELDSIQLPEDDLPALTGMDEGYLAALAQEPMAPAAGTVAAAPTSQVREQSADPTRVRSDDDVVSLNISMTVVQRTAAIARLDEIKAEQGMTTRSEAFLHLLQPMQPRTRTRRRNT